MMFYVTITPLLLLLTIWCFVFLDILIESTLFSNTTVGLVWGMFASVICLAFGLFHVLLSYAIYYQFRESGWFEGQQR